MGVFIYIWLGSPRAKTLFFLFTSLCVLCFSASSLQAGYSNIYFSCFTVFRLQKYEAITRLLEELLPKITVSDVSSRFKFRGYYTTLFPGKVITFFGDFFSWGESCFFTSWEDLYFNASVSGHSSTIFLADSTTTVFVLSCIPANKPTGIFFFFCYNCSGWMCFV